MSVLKHDGSILKKGYNPSTLDMKYKNKYKYKYTIQKTPLHNYDTRGL